ncbi:MAG TPA: hypothetical protein VFR26_11735 [Acidimicrobiales bacterium]|nr:hypothetical protein [Acidimicrobiales bacterium]
MIRTIVEGEPGMFPEPVARIMRGIGGLFRRKPQPADTPPTDTPPTDPPPSDTAPTDPPPSDDRPGHSGDST